MNTLQNNVERVDTRPTRRDALLVGLGVLTMGSLAVVELVATQDQRTKQKSRIPAPPAGSKVPVLSPAEILENRDCVSGEWVQTHGFARFDREIERVDISGIKGIATQSIVSQYNLYQNDGVGAPLLGRFWRLEVWPGGESIYRGLDATQVHDIVIKVE